MTCNNTSAYDRMHGWMLYESFKRRQNPMKFSAQHFFCVPNWVKNVYWIDWHKNWDINSIELGFSIGFILPRMKFYTGMDIFF